MKLSRLTLALLTPAVATLSLPALAETERQHGAHEHGAARLMVSAEGRELVIALDSPAYNVFGFEHQPSTDAQRATIDDVAAVLNDGADLFGLSAAAACEFEDGHVDTRLLAESAHDEHEHDEAHHDDHAHEHEHEHDEAHHDDHEHDAHHDDHADEHHDEAHHDEHPDADYQHAASETEAGHSDVRVEWHFECADLSRLSEIEVRLFGFFPNLNDLDAQYITADDQGAAELSPGATVLRF